MPVTGGFAAVSSDPKFYADDALANVEFERTGLDEGVAGWFRSRNTTSDFTFLIDRAESDPTEVGGAAKFTYVWWSFRPRKIVVGSWKAALSFTWLVSLATKTARVQFFESAGTYKFRLVIDGTVVATGTTDYGGSEQTFRLCTRIQVIAGSGNNVWKLYVNGTEEISYTVSSSYDDGGANVHYHGLGTMGGLDILGFSAGASSDSGNDAFYGTFICAHDTTDTLDETWYTEARGLFPNGNGFHDDMASNAGSFGTADESQVDDWEANGLVNDADHWIGSNAIEEQTATFDDVTLTNTSYIAVQQHDRRWADVASKNIPHNAYHRRNATNKAIIQSVLADTTKRLFVTLWATPASGIWSQANINDSEFGASRTADGANMLLSAIGVVTLSLGANNTLPAAPPADPPRVLSQQQTALLAVRGNQFPAHAGPVSPPAAAPALPFVPNQPPTPKEPIEVVGY